MDFETILTHPGGSHKDELLACCVLLAVKPVAIVRREPTADDLADAAVCVVDVGDEHAPERNNFDHHQFPKDHPPTCSLSLVLQHLGLYEDAKQFCEWLEPAEWFDSRGPGRTAEWLGVERDIVGKMNSPIDVTLLRRFAQVTSLEPGEPIWEVMRMIGQDLLDYIHTLRARLDYIAKHAQLWNLGTEEQPFNIIYMPRTDPLPDDPSMGLGRYIESMDEAVRAVGMVYPDRRGTGYGMARYNDHPELDFTRIESDPQVRFAHKSGFMAKLETTEPEELKKLVARARV